MCGITSRIPKKQPSWFTPRTLRQFSVLQSCTASYTAMPALFTRTSSLPCAATMSVTTRFQCSSFETSNSTPVTPAGKIPDGAFEPHFLPPNVEQVLQILRQSPECFHSIMDFGEKGLVHADESQVIVIGHVGLGTDPIEWSPEEIG